MNHIYLEVKTRLLQIVLFNHLLSMFVLPTKYFETGEKSMVALITFEVLKTKNQK